jgi:hypothetical protein
MWYKNFSIIKFISPKKNIPKHKLKDKNKIKIIWLVKAIPKGKMLNKFNNKIQKKIQKNKTK